MHINRIVDWPSILTFLFKSCFGWLTLIQKLWCILPWIFRLTISIFADVADCWRNLARYAATGARGLQYPLSIRSLLKVPKTPKWLGDKDTGAYKRFLSWNGHLVRNCQIRLIKWFVDWNPVQNETVRSSIGCTRISINSWVCMLDRTSL
jgi:hypothetical protein